MSAASLVGTRVLVTGAAGFIGMHVARTLLRSGALVTGVDNFDPYYDVALKEARIAELAREERFAFERLDLAEAGALSRAVAQTHATHIVHLAAQPGVRYSIDHPDAYVRNNLVAFGHVLEACRHARVAHLVYASSSSVYGAPHTLPFSEDARVDRPVSFYAATKVANEVMAHSYSHLFGIPMTGVRFFTVYGPWGRPDQAPMLFARAILAGEPIRLFNHGRMQRDFTYVDDVAEGVARILARPPQASAGGPPHAIFNLGHHRAVELNEFLDTLERLLGKRAIREMCEMQPGDVPATYAAIDRVEAAIGFAPRTSLADGLARFVAWYREYYASRERVG